MARQGVGNGEAVELGLREALCKDGRRRLEELYAHPHLPIPDHTRRPGEPCHPERKLQRHSRLGPVTLSRNYCYCSSAQTGRFPLAEALGLVESFSPALVRLAARAAAREGYEAASADMAALAGIQIEGRQIHRRVNALAPPLAGPWETGHDPDAQPMAVRYVEVDATGVPMVAEALAGRPGQQADGSSTTREAKLGCVFTPTQLDPKTNRPERDPDSTSDVGSFEPAADFGRRLRREALRRGMGRAIQIVFLGDGAAWLGELARVNFPSALWIVDLDQALERLPPLCEGL